MDHDKAETIRQRITPANCDAVYPVVEFIKQYRFSKTRCRLDEFKTNSEKFTLQGAGLVRLAIEKGCYDLFFVTINLRANEKPENAIANFVRSSRWPAGVKPSYLAVSMPAGNLNNGWLVSSHVHLIAVGIPLTVAAQAAAQSFWKDKQHRRHKSFDGKIVYDIAGIFKYMQLPKNLGLEGGRIHASRDVKMRALLVARTGPTVLTDCLSPINDRVLEIKRSGQHAPEDFMPADRAPCGLGLMKFRGFFDPKPITDLRVHHPSGNGLSP